MQASRRYSAYELVLLETLALAVLLLSVYIINFELDYLQLETAKGKYQEIESLS